MLAQTRMFLPTVLLLAAATAVICAATGFGWRSWSPAYPSAATMTAPALIEPAALHSVCVTPQGLCPSLPARSGDPCSCPHQLRGMVPGHAERAAGAPAMPRSRDWMTPLDPEGANRWEAPAGP
jgi:hypothetical protein